MRAFYRATMRRGAPILFVLSLLITAMAFVEAYQTLHQSEGVDLAQFDVLTRFQLLLTALAHSLLLGALPFGCAVLIDRIDRFLARSERKA